MQSKERREPITKSVIQTAYETIMSGYAAEAEQYLLGSAEREELLTKGEGAKDLYEFIKSLS